MNPASGHLPRLPSSPKRQGDLSSGGSADADDGAQHANFPPRLSLQQMGHTPEPVYPPNIQVSQSPEKNLTVSVKYDISHTPHLIHVYFHGFLPIN